MQFFVPPYFSNKSLLFVCLFKKPRKFTGCGSVSVTTVSTICQDTGSSGVIISDAVLPDAVLTGAKIIDVYDYLGRVDTYPIVRCYLCCAYYNGWVDAIRAPIKFCSVLIGNIRGVNDYTNPIN